MSKRIIKNIIMIILIVALCVSLYFTLGISRNPFGNENMKKEFSENREIPEGTNGEIPEMPEGGFERGQRLDSFEEGSMPEGFDKGNLPNRNGARPNNTLTTVLVGVEIFGIVVLVIYLILSKFNKLTLKETFSDKSKILSYIALVVLITAIAVMLVLVINKNNRTTGNMRPEMGGFEENKDKDTKAEDVDAGESVNTETINLTDHTSNITITEAGNYTLTGSFGYTVLVNAEGEVTLNLDNAKIENKTTAALANISTNSLIINLKEGTSNTFSDGGSSEYDACVYSAGPLTIKGEGSLEVYGNQEDGEGIATETNDITIDGGNIKIQSSDDGLNAGGDGGTIKINDGTIYIKASGDGIDSNKNIVINGGYVYTMGSSLGGDAGLDADNGTQINGGTVIALGSDMLEAPKNSSRQKFISTNLNSSIESGSKVSLKNESNEEVISFIADEKFRTLIISDAKLKVGKYKLYSGEELIEELECK